MSTSRLRLLPVIVVAAFVCVSSLFAQTSAMLPAAPLPGQLSSARKVFISYAGGYLDKAWGPAQIYTRFYTDVKNWGHFEMVGTPSEADLVLQIGFWGGDRCSLPQLRLTLLDPKTHIELWELTEYVQLAALQKTWDKNFENAFERVDADLKDLITRASSPPGIAGGPVNN